MRKNRGLLIVNFKRTFTLLELVDQFNMDDINICVVHTVIASSALGYAIFSNLYYHSDFHCPGT